jgi:hypothetical protein
MSRTLISMALIISLIAAAILITGIWTFAQVELTQTNSNSQGVSPSNGTTTATNAVSASFITYENSSWGIKIQYPSSWVKQISGRGVTFAVLPMVQTVIATILG